MSSPTTDGRPTTKATIASSDGPPSWRATYLGSDNEGRPGSASWGAILAGVMVSLAVLVTFSFLGAALGLGLTDPTSDQPFEGVGFGLGIWAILTLVLALAAGGFVAGVLAVRGGFMHGLSVWATTTVALLVALTLGIGAAIGAAGSVLGSVGSAIGGGASTIASTAGDAVGALVDDAAQGLDVDWADLGGDVEKILADTDVEELQPEYLKTQLDEARSDITDAAADLVTDPEAYEKTLDDLFASLQQRAETIGNAVDRDAIANAVESNTDLTGEEAREAVNNAVAAVDTAAAQTEQAISDAQNALEQAKQEAEKLVADARQTLDDATDAAARAAVWAFFGLLLGAAITAFAGLWGSRLVISRTVSGSVDTEV